MLEFDLSELLEEDSSVSSNYISKNTTKVESTSTITPVESSSSKSIPNPEIRITSFSSVPANTVSSCKGEVLTIWENSTKQTYLTKNGEIRNEPIKKPSINTPENIIQGLNATLLKKSPIPLNSKVRIYLRDADPVSAKKPMRTRTGAIEKNSLIPLDRPNYARTPEAKRSTKSNASQGGAIYGVNEREGNVECPDLEKVLIKKKDQAKLFAPIELIFCSDGLYRKGFFYSPIVLTLFQQGDNEDFEEWFASVSKKGEDRGDAFYRLFPQLFNPDLQYLYLDAIESIWIGSNCLWKYKPKKQDEHQVQMQKDIAQRSSNNVKNSLVHNLSTVLTNMKSSPFMLAKVPNKIFRYYLKDSDVIILESMPTNSQINFFGKTSVPVQVSNTSEDDWCLEGKIAKIQISIKPRKLPRFIKFMNHSSLYLHILHAINKYEKGDRPVDEQYFLNFRSPDYAKLDRIGCIESAVPSEGGNKWHIRVKNESRELVFIRGIESEVKDDLHKSISKHGIMQKLDINTLESTNKWYLLEVWNHLSNWFSKLPNYYFHDNCATKESVKKYEKCPANIRNYAKKLLKGHITSGRITDKFGKPLTENNINLLVDMLDANWYRFSEDEFWKGKVLTNINYNPKFKLSPVVFFMNSNWKDEEQWARISSKLVYMLTGYELNFYHNEIPYNYRGYSNLTKWLNDVYSTFPPDMLPKKGMLLSKLVSQLKVLDKRGYTNASKMYPSQWDVVLNEKLLDCKIEKFI